MKRYSTNFCTIGFKQIELNVLKYICAQVKAEFDRWFVINYPLKIWEGRKSKNCHRSRSKNWNTCWLIVHAPVCTMHVSSIYYHIQNARKSQAYASGAISKFERNVGRSICYRTFGKNTLASVIVNLIAVIIAIIVHIWNIIFTKWKKIPSCYSSISNF